MVEFKEWPKIPRGGPNETVTITEKIDGTNACVIVAKYDNGMPYVAGAQSRTQLLWSQEDGGLIIIHGDNYGFGKWTRDHLDELAQLGEGYHYGEWAGEGIQKNHHNIKGKKFFLFNYERWRDGRQERPTCCECVPVLYEGPAYIEDGDGGIHAISFVMDKLWNDAKEGGWYPEGIVVWYHKSRRYEKHTFENAEGKWKNN